MPVPSPVRVPIQARWRDLDAFGHVNNAVYFTYFEHARIGYIHALLPGAQLLDINRPVPRDMQFIIAEATCHYRAPAVLGDQLAVSIHVSRVGHKSLIFEYRLVEEKSGRLVAEGCTTQVFYDYATGRSKPVPEDLIARIEQLQGAPVARGDGGGGAGENSRIVA
jgi:acyl-CoA thioester hydrolase